MVTANLARSNYKRANLDTAMYSLSEVARLWGISYSKANELALADQLPVPAMRIGRTFKFPRAIVDRQLGIDVHCVAFRKIGAAAINWDWNVGC